MHRPFLLALAIGILIPAPAAGEPSRPTGAWKLHRGDTDCMASRSYGTEEKPLVFGLRPSPRGKTMQILLMRRGWSSDVEHIDAIVKLPAATMRVNGLRYESGDGKHEILRMNLDEAAVAQIRAAPTIEIESFGTVEGSFAVPGIEKAVSALEKCNLDLQARWNIEEDGNAGFAEPATSLAPLDSYLESKDYPAQAMRERMEGKVGVTLMIDEEGVLKDCYTEESSGIALLDTRTCSILVKRAKFRPATDASGNPVRSVLDVVVRWYFS